MHTYERVGGGGGARTQHHHLRRWGGGKRVALVLFFLFAALAGGIFWYHHHSFEQEGRSSTPGFAVHRPGEWVQPPPPAFTFAKPQERFSTHLLLDKPVYRPGEVVRASCFVLNAFAVTEPMSAGGAGAVQAMAKVRDGKGVEILSLHTVGELVNGVWAVQFQLPESASGGEYVLAVEPYGSEAVSRVERRFEVRATRMLNAKANKRLEFGKEGYLAGEEVSSTLTVETGGAQAGGVVAVFVATVDAQEVARSGELAMDAKTGKVTFAFVLPLSAAASSSSAVLVAKVRLGGGGEGGAVWESVSKTVPLITGELKIAVFPESSGAGLLRGHVTGGGGGQRVYVQVEDPNRQHRPVDFTAEVYVVTSSDSSSSSSAGRRKVADVSSLHEGRGVSTPFQVDEHARRVFVRLTSPRAQEVDVPLPDTHKISFSAASNSSSSSVFTDKLQLHVQSVLPLAAVQSFTIAVYKRDAMLASRRLTAQDVAAGVTFDFTANRKNYGVLRCTLLDHVNKLPVAERLVFRVPPRALEVELAATVLGGSSENKAAAAAVPGDGVAVEVRTWLREVDGETGELLLHGRRQPVPAVVAVRVTDSALAGTVEDRLLPPRLPSMVLLETETLSSSSTGGTGEPLLDAGAFFPAFGGRWAWLEQPPRQRGTFKQRIDLLLGVQGWRRFAYADAQSFVRTGKVLSTSSLEQQQQQELIPEVPKLVRERMFAMREQEHIIMYAAEAAQDAAFHMRMKRGAAGRPEMMMMMMANAPPQLAFAVNEEEDDEEALEDDDEAVVMEDAAVTAGEEEEEEDAQMGDGDAGDEAPVAPARLGKRHAGFFVPPQMPTAFARVYAFPQKRYTKHELEQQQQGSAEPARSDFTETVYFNPSLQTQCTTTDVCSARVEFGLSDSSSATFVVHGDGISTASQPAAVGAGSTRLRSQKPGEVDFKLPSAVVQGDEPRIPVYYSSSSAPPLLVSSNAQRLEVVKVAAAASSSSSSRGRLVRTGKLPGLVNLTLSSSKDSITRSTLVLPRGFPVHHFASGMAKPHSSSSASHAFPALPSDYVSGTLQVSAVVYTSPLGQLTKALEALIQEPYGCFEQTSSTTYPLIFVLQYLENQPRTSKHDKLISKARDLLNKGYAKLVSFESPGGGFEWFGAEPGHEALTAYGLVQFAAMAQLQRGSVAVDETMMERTRQWMAQRRDGQGGYLRNARSLDSFGAAPDYITNAYITWALVRAKLLRGAQTRELDRLVDQATRSEDPYVVALAALSLYDAAEEQEGKGKDKQLADGFAQRLADDMQPEDAKGAVRGAVDTITRSRGDALVIESTALAALVWTKTLDRFGASARRAIDFLATMCRDGRFASTQATALTLMAIVEYDKAVRSRGALPAGSAVEIVVDGQVVQRVELVVQHQPAAAAAEDDKDCGRAVAGAFWNECGSACSPSQCGKDEGEGGDVVCSLQCVAKCDCPPERPWLAANGKECVADCSTGSGAGAEEEGVLRFAAPGLVERLSAAGEHAVSVRLALPDGASTSSSSSTWNLPYSIAVHYSVDTPRSSPKLALALEVQPAAVRVYREGDVVELHVSITNLANTTVPMLVCVVGVPGGFEPRTDQLLRELLPSKRVDFIETQPGSITLYWRALPGLAKITNLPVHLTAQVPGRYQAPASRAYAFYHDEEKVFAKSYEVEIE